MLDDVSAYRPDFSSGNWSERDLHYLQAFATNPQGIISDYGRSVFACVAGFGLVV